MAIAGGIAGIATGSVSTAVGFGLGVAVSAALEPEATSLRQEFWKLDPSKVVSTGVAARVVAQGLRSASWGREEAVQQGTNSDRWEAELEAAHTAPDVATLLTLWRRGEISDADLTHGLRKQALEPRWDSALESLRRFPLTGEQVAVGVQRGLLPNRDLLPVAPPTGGGTVPPMPMVDLDPYEQAAGWAVGPEQLKVLTRMVGLPPGPGELLQLLNRGVIDATDYRRGIAEGNMRNEWAPALEHLRRRLISPNQYAELRLRGWIDDAAMHAGASLSGMHEADTDLLHKLEGRPIPVHQVRTGIARGGTFEGSHAGIPDAYLRSLEEGNLRPEWYNLAYHNRYSLPSAFVIRSLLTSGAISAARGEELFLWSGWPPDLASTVANHLAGGTATAAKRLTASQLLTEYEGHYITRADLITRLESLGYGPVAAGNYADLGDARRVASARNSRVSTIHRRYIGHKITRAQAQTALEDAHVPIEARTLLLDNWDGEREINTALLTPAQIKRAAKLGIYTVSEALTLLEERGYDPADAHVLLDRAP